MKKQTSLLANSDSGYKITLNQQNQDLQKLFSQFKGDFDISHTQSNNENKQFLSTTALTDRKPVRTHSKDKKRMKLIDYIYIKNTAKKNAKSQKIDKTGMSANQLRKSRMKEGKQKAFKAIVDEMISQFKQVSSKALTMAQLAEQTLTYSGNTDDIAKLCNIRRILKDNILKNMTEVQKLMGIETHDLQTKSRQRIEQNQDFQLDNRLKRLQALGVQRLEPEINSLKPLTERGLKVEHKYSNKDTWISQQQDQREDP